MIIDTEEYFNLKKLYTRLLGVYEIIQKYSEENKARILADLTPLMKQVNNELTEFESKIPHSTGDCLRGNYTVPACRMLTDEDLITAANLWAAKLKQENLMTEPVEGRPPGFKSYVWNILEEISFRYDQYLKKGIVIEFPEKKKPITEAEKAQKVGYIMIYIGLGMLALAIYLVMRLPDPSR